MHFTYFEAISFVKTKINGGGGGGGWEKIPPENNQNRNQ